ncbi:hypothetical protein A2Z10_03285 [Candidatus Azambacteria bacterium RBG_16_47_10]|uniref:Uncharacterized protein n=1 Tax=Candidatus Azambacteria bacterium RBG_16_47_10 TaxID=1797292 RepID=A0A1F5B141_9BACT|nr:MAG: hypothetical protein A2Z10_03285 [Candidatus Azambacteria bacterium RBG_16_47_10]
MRAILLQRWDDVEYGKERIRSFLCWSNLVEGRGDEKLKPSRSSMLGAFNWLRKYFRWKKYIILVPKTKVYDVPFRVGFYSKQLGVCKISTAVRNASDGPFAMRMGPEDCHFFVVGKASIELAVAEYIRKDLDFF